MYSYAFSALIAIFCILPPLLLIWTIFKVAQNATPLRKKIFTAAMVIEVPVLLATTLFFAFPRCNFNIKIINYLDRFHLIFIPLLLIVNAASIITAIELSRHIKPIGRKVNQTASWDDRKHFKNVIIIWLIVSLFTIAKFYFQSNRIHH